MLLAESEDSGDCSLLGNLSDAQAFLPSPEQLTDADARGAGICTLRLQGTCCFSARGWPPPQAPASHSLVDHLPMTPWGIKQLWDLWHMLYQSSKKHVKVSHLSA